MTDAPLIQHLIELRGRIISSIVSVLFIFLCLAYFSQDIYEWLAKPLLSAMPQGSSMIATDVAAPFLAPFKLTLFVSFFVALPWVLFQLWQFIAPGLYQSEKNLVLPLVCASTLLFYGGVAFSYFLVFPVIFEFLTQVAPEGVVVSTDISSYLSFVLKLFFAFGLAFEIPILIIVLCRTGTIEPNALARKRPYIIVGAFVLGMLLTPPDVFSQIMLAVPTWLLFELGLIIGKFITPKSQSDQPLS